MQGMMNRLAAAAVAAILAASIGCSSSQPVRSGDRPFNTVAGQQLKPEMFLGKWDLDGQRTNEANGKSAATAIPSSIFKDVMGAGWRFERDGVMFTDAATSAKPGKWSLEGLDVLVIQEYQKPEPVRYAARFSDGYLRLKRADGVYLVLQRNKFFGF